MSRDLKDKGFLLIAIIVAALAGFGVGRAQTRISAAPTVADALQLAAKWKMSSDDWEIKAHLAAKQALRCAASFKAYQDSVASK